MVKWAEIWGNTAFIKMARDGMELSTDLKETIIGFDQEGYSACKFAEFLSLIIEKLFPNNGEKIVDSCQTTETIWPVTSFKLFIVHVHGYILVTIGSGFLFWNQNFCLQIITVCYFNKVRYLFGMNNQLTLPRTEKLFYFKITSS